MSDSSDNVCGVAGNKPDKKCDVVCVMGGCSWRGSHRGVGCGPGTWL